MKVPDCLSSVMRQINKTKTSTDKPGPNYMTVPKLESHKKGAAAAAVNYLSCCMKIEKKSIWLSCSLAWLSLAWVGNLPILHSFLALWTQSSFFPPLSKLILSSFHGPNVQTAPSCRTALPCTCTMQWRTMQRPLSWLRLGRARVELSQTLSQRAISLLRRESIVVKNQIQMN